MVSWSRPRQQNEPELIDDVEEIGADREEFDPDVEVDHDDAEFVNETGGGRARGRSIAKLVAGGAFGLLFAVTAFGTGYGLSSAIGRSGISPAAFGADEQSLVADSYSPTSYPTSYSPTYAPSAVEEDVVTVRPFIIACVRIGIDICESNLTCVSCASSSIERSRLLRMTLHPTQLPSLLLSPR